MRFYFDRDAIHDGISGQFIDHRNIGEVVHAYAGYRVGHALAGIRRRPCPQRCGIQTTPGMTSSLRIYRKLDAGRPRE